MRTKAEIFQEYFNVQTYAEARKALQALKMAPRKLPLSAYTKLELPYEAPGVAGIPSLEEIELAMTSRLDGKYAYRPVCKIGNMIVQKDWSLNLVQEAEDLLWLQENTQVRVPKLYACFNNNQNGEDSYYLVMERIEGLTIDWTIWRTLSEAQHEKIHSSLAQQFQLLRSVPSPGYYGRINNQPYFPLGSMTATTGLAPCGPYTSYDELIVNAYAAAEYQAAMLYPHAQDKSDRTAFKPEQLAWLKKFKTVFFQLPGHEPRLTLAGPGMHNWIVTPLHGATSLQEATDYQVTLVDWSLLGWHPAWMQRLYFEQAADCIIEELPFTMDTEGEERIQKRVAQYFDEDYSEPLKIKKEMGPLLGYWINI